MVKHRGETKFNRYMTGMRPFIYIILTVALTLWDFNTLGIYSVIPLLLIIPGYLTGFMLTRSVKFRTDEKGEHYYRRPRTTLALYLGAVVLRVLAESLLPASFISDIVINSLLGLATGVLVGEARSMRKKIAHNVHVHPLAKKNP